MVVEPPCISVAVQNTLEFVPKSILALRLQDCNIKVCFNKSGEYRQFDVATIETNNLCLFDILEEILCKYAPE